MWTETLNDVEHTLAFGQSLGVVSDEMTRVALSGELGAGKTSLAQGVGLGLGCAVSVVSPTFILLAEYHCGRIPLLHGDAYRLREGEAESIGMDETVETWPGLVLMEWADRVPHILGDEYLKVQLIHFGSSRQVEVSAVGEHHLVLLRRWRDHFYG